MSYSKTYPILHHGFVDVPRHIKAETGRMQTILLHLYSHVMNVDIYRATRPSKARFIILLLLYLGIFTFISCFSVLCFQPVAIFWTTRDGFNPKALHAGFAASKWCWERFVYKHFAFPSSVVPHCYTLIHTHIIRMNRGLVTGPIPQRYSLNPTQNDRWLLIYQFNLIFHIWPASSILGFLCDQINSTLPCQSTNLLF